MLRGCKRQAALPRRGSEALTLRRALLEWWRENLRRFGYRRACGIFLSEMREFLREATPSRRKQRYGDVDFDWDYRVDTTSANVSRRTDLLGTLAGRPYQPADPSLFHESIRALALDYTEFDFIDLGSGKGRTLLMASDYPFRRIVGVEIVPELHRVAMDNIRRYRSDSQKCFAVQSVCGDARDFQFPPAPTVLFLFNPLPEAGLRTVVAALEKSLREQPRQVFVVYHNPVLEDVLSEGGMLTKISGNLQVATFRSPASCA